jgi:Mg2+ and Co2+ transporter CorA
MISQNSDSDFTPMDSSNSDLMRIERKVDKLTEAMQQLIRVEERQSNQGIRLGDCEKELITINARLEAVDKKVDQWVNRGIGVWALAVTLWALFEFATSHGLIALGVK